MRAGRFINADDVARREPVGVVDEVFAQRNWPGESALGRQIVNGIVNSGQKPHTIVGVVGP